jgi:hypothetical protein
MDDSKNNSFRPVSPADIPAGTPKKGHSDLLRRFLASDLEAAEIDRLEGVDMTDSEQVFKSSHYLRTIAGRTKLPVRVRFRQGRLFLIRKPEDE